MRKLKNNSYISESDDMFVVNFRLGDRGGEERTATRGMAEQYLNNFKVCTSFCVWSPQLGIIRRARTTGAGVWSELQEAN